MADKPCKSCIHEKACITANPDMVKKTYQCEHYLPTADVVEVVRCKDCARAIKLDGCCICSADNETMLPDDFCSYGERK